MPEDFVLTNENDTFRIYVHKNEIHFGIYEDAGYFAENIDVYTYLSVDKAKALRDGLSEVIARLEK